MIAIYKDNKKTLNNAFLFGRRCFGIGHVFQPKSFHVEKNTDICTFKIH